MGRQELLEKLRAHSAAQLKLPAHYKQAAVAVILREFDEELRMLFIQRTRHEGDPWSGHMAFPGGRVDPEDESPLAAARRETLEEVGIFLEERHFVAAVQEIQASARGSRLEMVVFPFVFFWDGNAETVHAADEVAATVWIPVDLVLDTSRHTTFDNHYDNRTVRMSCIEYNGYRIWGMTYRMIQNLIAAVES